MKGVIYRDISENDLLSFMDKSNVEYSIPREAYKSVFDNYYKANDIIKSFNMSLLNDFYDEQFPNVKKALADTITPSLVYDEGWRLEITTDSIINAIMRNFGSIYRAKDYSAKFDGNPISNTKRVIRELGEIENRIYTFDTNRLYDSLSYNILNAFKDKGRDYENLREEVGGFLRTTRYLIADNIFEDLPYNNIGTLLEGTYQPKNLLYVLAISSLLKLEKYKDSDYSLLPNTYYERISKVGSSPYAKSVWFKGKKYFTYTSFNELYNKILLENNELLRPKTNPLDNVDILFDKFIFIPDGEGYKKEHITKESSRELKVKTEDFETLKNKIEFFENTHYTHKMLGIDSLNGYMGYVYDNDFIVFERFYRDKENSKPASNEAIYVMPADKLLLSLTDKQAIMKYIKENPEQGVKRIIHRGENYKDQVNEVITSPNISNESFSSIYDRMKESKKILIKK